MIKHKKLGRNDLGRIDLGPEQPETGNITHGNSEMYKHPVTLVLINTASFLEPSRAGIIYHQLLNMDDIEAFKNSVTSYLTE